MNFTSTSSVHVMPDEHVIKRLCGLVDVRTYSTARLIAFSIHQQDGYYRYNNKHRLSFFVGVPIDSWRKLTVKHIHSD